MCLGRADYWDGIGALKVLLGIAQTVSALVVGLVIGVPSRIVGKKSILNHSWTYAMHGAGNVVAGSVEAIPLVGSIAYYERCRREKAIQKTTGLDLWTHHENKFMPYESLEAQDFEVVGEKKKS